MPAGASYPNYYRPIGELEEIDRRQSENLTPHQRWDKYVADSDALDGALSELSFLEDKARFKELVEADLGELVLTSVNIPADTKLTPEFIAKQVVAYRKKLEEVPTITDAVREPQRPIFDNPDTLV